MTKGYDKDRVIFYLGQFGIKFGTPLSSRTIVVPKRIRIGIKIWGMIDFLINYCGYFGWMKT